MSIKITEKEEITSLLFEVVPWESIKAAFVNVLGKERGIDLFGKLNSEMSPYVKTSIIQQIGLEKKIICEFLAKNI